jgi:cellulose synthase/poly-beta-1,6-N-acetylglucosamine synthase-like glycosyltransferase
MSDASLRLVAVQPATDQPRLHKPLGTLLVEDGVITRPQLVSALALQMRLRAPLGEILVAEGWAESRDIRAALARQHGLRLVDLDREPPVPELCRLMPWRFWMRHKAVPWMRIGRVLLVATARPDRIDRLRAALVRDLGAGAPELLPVLAAEAQIDTAIARINRRAMAAAAGTRVAARFSCRTWTAGRRLPVLAALAAASLAILVLSGLALPVLFGAAVLTLMMFGLLRLAGFIAHLLSHRHLTAPEPPPQPAPPGALPAVSVLVPLFREREIAGALIERLQRLTYPKALLEVILVLEEDDAITRHTLTVTRLPSWIRVIEVPAHGGLTTKPRAMNYALDFCKGDIVGVWDAEDAPAPDQIERVVAHFATAGSDVVCVQGILDFYNPRSNWRARCFTIEYSGWFRIVLPGIARLRLVVPLGGTTLFFRRAALEQLGGWEAHNVTEDADLGVRLARAGWRTELIDTVTHEEANHRAWPWVKQRSRWLKGFMVTYLVHMRRPLRLWRDLGTWRFLGFQAFFLGTLGQFLMAPVLWCFWPLAFGLLPPFETMPPDSVLRGAAILFLATELLGICVGLAAVSASRRRFLLPFVPTMILYFPLGVLAAYKALWELCFRPFFWDKTQHGQAGAETVHP